MHPADTLSNEHKVILGQLDSLEEEIRKILGGAPVSGAYFKDALDFFREFADVFHHAKEERLLFPRMQERGVPGEGGPIGVMLAEHDEGRGYLKRVRDNLDAAVQNSPEARADVVAAASAYISMLRNHIYKEDSILFRIAHMVLGPDDVAELELKFAAVEAPQRFRTLV